MFKEIKIDDITIKERLREVDNLVINDLCMSIKNSGLLNPITINQNNILISGYHRLTAFKKLEKETIPCKIVNTDNEDEMKLIEIDENLMRVELHFLDLAEQLEKRKNIYEKLYPETKKGGTGKGRSKNVTSFVDSLEGKVNKGKSSIYTLINIAKKLDKKTKQNIKKVGLTQSETVKFLDLDEKVQELTLDYMMTYNLNYTKACNELKENLTKAKVKTPITKEDIDFNSKIDIGNVVDILKSKKELIDFNLCIVDINALKIDPKEEMDILRKFTESIKEKINNKTLVLYISNSKIDLNLENLINKNYNYYEKIYIPYENENKEDFLFQQKVLTIFICSYTRDDILKKQKNKNENLIYGLDSTSRMVEYFGKLLNVNTIKVFEPFVSNYDLFVACELNDFEYYGICDKTDRFRFLEKKINLKNYLNEENLKVLKPFQYNTNIITYKYIISLAENISCLIYVDDEINDFFDEFFIPTSIHHDALNSTKILKLRDNIYMALVNKKISTDTVEPSLYNIRQGYSDLKFENSVIYDLEYDNNDITIILAEETFTIEYRLISRIEKGKYLIGKVRKDLHKLFFKSVKNPNVIFFINCAS